MSDINNKEEQIVMEIIMHSANAKGLIYEALKVSKENKFDESYKMLKEANESINKAHKSQTEWLTGEASGEERTITALLVHAQDHLMTTMSEMNVMKEVIILREEIYQN